MEQNIELLSIRPPVLNEYCLLEIFKHLNLVDSISFADCCRYLRMVAHRAFRRYSNFHLNCIHLRKGGGYVNKVMSHIGSQVSTLEINGTYLNLDLILKIVGDNCTNLKYLKLTEERQRRIGNNIKSIYNFRTVETLVLVRYESSYARGFLPSFRRLKSLSVSRCFITAEEAKELIQNNPNIEILCGEDLSKNLQIFRQVSTLTLTKLRLDCMSKNINRLLRELAKDGIMEEMELIDVDVDDQFFKILTLFGRIKLLEIGYDNKTRHELLFARRSYKTLKPSTVWPSSLQSLRLIYFEFTLNGLVEIVRQLSDLKCLDLVRSIIAQSDFIYFRDSMALGETFLRILHAVDSNTGKQCRKLALPYLFRYFTVISSCLFSANAD